MNANVQSLNSCHIWQPSPHLKRIFPMPSFASAFIADNLLLTRLFARFIWNVCVVVSSQSCSFLQLVQHLQHGLLLLLFLLNFFASLPFFLKSISLFLIRVSLIRLLVASCFFTPGQSKRSENQTGESVASGLSQKTAADAQLRSAFHLFLYERHSASVSWSFLFIKKNALKKHQPAGRMS